MHAVILESPRRIRFLFIYLFFCFFLSSNTYIVVLTVEHMLRSSLESLYLGVQVSNHNVLCCFMYFVCVCVCVCVEKQDTQIYMSTILLRAIIMTVWTNSK